ncbi:MAG: GNAT family N-acetyltransferase [Ilumatobacteraceae bacterium]
MEVVELAAEQTHPLRLEVLRRGTPSRDVAFVEDDQPGTLHLGVELGGVVVGVSTWIVNAHPDLPATPGVQLRGMATAPQLQGQGIGGLLVETGVERMFGDGCELVWARARDSALAFYARHGFAPRGRGYVDVVTGIPHHDIVRQR